MYDICIIGGGASGMTAAIVAAMRRNDLKICIVEKKEEPGRKLRATGSGRCNLSNMGCGRLNWTKEFFSSIGIYLSQERGWIYPASRQAGDVVKAFHRALERCDIDVIVNSKVEKVRREKKTFVVDGEIQCKNLLIATGGKASPVHGTTGDGYAFAKAMGHRVTKLYPVLTAVETKELVGMKGIRSKAKVSLVRKGSVVAEEEGEVQFTETGLSGICIFNLSRYILLDHETSFSDYQIIMDFSPFVSLSEVEEEINRRLKQGLDPIHSMVHSKLSPRIKGKGAGAGEMAKRIKGFPVVVTGVKGWKNAQCTGGGVVLKEIHRETMESKLIDGLFFAGEILDYDGPCGGYNLQNAWETGIKAGKGMAEKRSE